MKQPDITGYRELSQTEADVANELKAISKQFIDACEKAKIHGADGRWMAQARTSMQNACMQACRAVFKPSDDC